MRIAVIGAGHAGVEAATFSSGAGAEVELYSAEAGLPYFRPRVVALAFGASDPEAMRMHPGGWYADRKIDMRSNTPVTAIDTSALRLTAGGASTPFDAIVVAIGAGPALPSVAARAPNGAIPLWNEAHALRIGERALRGNRRVLVVGGGTIGVEAAIRAAQAGCEVTVIDKAPGLLSSSLDDTESDLVRRYLESRNVRVRTLTELAAVRDLDGEVEAVFGDGSVGMYEVAVLSVGVRRDLRLAHAAGLTTGSGVRADAFLQTSRPGIFVCGDIAQTDGALTCSAREAAAQGRAAAFNAVAHAAGEPAGLRPWPRRPSLLSLRVHDFEVHVAGWPVKGPFVEEVLPGDGAGTRRVVVRQRDRIVAVRMVGTHRDLQALVEQIPTEGVA